jgi:hypothetical protein
MHGYRISFLSGLATGYVLGTRAGRERYEQLKKAARTVADNPTVQQAAGAVQAQATGLVTAAGTKLSDGVRGRVPQLAKTARGKVEEHAPGHRGRKGKGGHSEHASNGSGDVGDGRHFGAMRHGDPNARH